MSRLLGSGPLLMVLASLAFTTMVACARFARQEMPGVELVFWRAVISLPLLVIAARGVRLMIGPGRGALILRSALGFCAMTCFYVAAREVDLLTLSLIMRLQPILVTLAAPVVLDSSEYAGRGAIVAALFGFVGSALLAAPKLQAGSWMILFALGAPFFAAGAHLALRRVAPNNSGTAIVTWFHLIMIPLALGGAAATRGGPPTMPTAGILWPVLGVGLFATVGQLLMTRAYSVERASLVASASYAGVLFALVYDLVLFGETPTWWALPGGAMVIGSSLWLVHRAQRKRAIGMVN